VTREQCDLGNIVAGLEQPAGRFVAQIVKMQIEDAEFFAGAVKSSSY
jgi:hypothetical protein